jgi:hypothetical protein
MTESRNTKLVVLPEELVKELESISKRLGISISNFATEALEQAIKIDKFNSSLNHAVDIYRLVTIQQGAGGLTVPRTTLNQFLTNFTIKTDEMEKIWFEAGRWYGEYLNTKLGYNESLIFLENDLKFSWNLDEVEILDNKYDVKIRCVSFMMTENLTELLLSYIRGIMAALNYKETKEEHLRGMIFLKYNKYVKNDN